MKILALELKIKYCWIYAVLSTALNPNIALAQSKTFPFEIQDLVVPDAPASAIIGSQISLKPAITPKAFGLSVLNSIADEEEFLNNIAIEFAPYWWSPRPELTFNDYYNKNSFGQFVFQSLSFSIASQPSTTIIDGDDEIDATTLGLGMRFALIAGKANPQVEQAKNKLASELRTCLNLIDEEISKRRTLKKKLVEDRGELEPKDFSGLLTTMKFFGEFYSVREQQAIVLDELAERIESPGDRKIGAAGKIQLKEILAEIAREFYQQNISINDNVALSDTIDNISKAAKKGRNDRCLRERNQKIDRLNTELRELEKARVGIQLESASAVGFDVRDSSFDELRFRNFATWLTASYRSDNWGKNKASPIEFLGVARYTFDELEDDNDSFFDIGGGIVYRLQQLPLVFSLEYVRRFGDDGDDRFVGVADYRINNIYSVFLSYGKDFETDFNGNEDLVTLFGLKVGLGKNPQTIETISQEQQ